MPPRAIPPTPASSLGSPADYYAGAPGWTGEPPRNILVFHRRSAQEARTEGLQMHPRHVLCLCLSGPGALTADGAAFGMRPGYGFLLLPFQQHHLSEFRNHSIDWLFVSFDLPESAALQALKDQPFRLSARARSFLAQLVKSYRAHVKGRVHRGADVTAWTMLLLGELAGTAERQEVTLDRVEAPESARLRQAVRHIYAGLREPFRVTACARSANLSASHLRRLFRRHLGCSLGRFVRQARVHHATALLHLTELTVTEIAERCGFGSVYAFSRTFAAVTGRSPSAYREILRHDHGDTVLDARAPFQTRRMTTSP